MLSTMLLIRKVEQQLALCKKNDLIGGPVHLGAGQEAIAVGVSQNLRKTRPGGTEPGENILFVRIPSNIFLGETHDTETLQEMQKYKSIVFCEVESHTIE